MPDRFYITLPNTKILQCPNCGCLVIDHEEHDRFHARLELVDRESLHTARTAGRSRR